MTLAEARCGPIWDGSSSRKERHSHARGCAKECRCGFDARPPHQRRVWSTRRLSVPLNWEPPMCVAKRKDAWRPGQTGAWGEKRVCRCKSGPPHQPRAGHTRVTSQKGAKHRAVRTCKGSLPTERGQTVPALGPELHGPNKIRDAQPLKRTRNGEAHNTPQAWSGPQRHGTCHHLLGA